MNEKVKSEESLDEGLFRIDKEQKESAERETKNEEKREAKEAKARKKAETTELKRQNKILEADRQASQFKTEQKTYKTKIGRRKLRAKKMMETGIGHVFSNVKKDTRRGKHGLRII